MPKEIIRCAHALLSRRLQFRDAQRLAVPAGKFDSLFPGRYDLTGRPACFPICILRRKYAEGSAFDLCGVHIEPFAVSHDVTAVGFAFTVPGRKIGYATDLGFISELAKVRLNGCDLLVLESNYDTKMLRMSKRQIQTKRRIAGNFGHLGNAQAMIALEELLAPNTKHLILAHISGECNDPEILNPLAEARLAELNRKDISFCLASQSDPLDTICIEE